jgi:hypothetical protein
MRLVSVANPMALVDFSICDMPKAQTLVQSVPEWKSWKTAIERRALYFSGFGGDF